MKTRGGVGFLPDPLLDDLGPQVIEQGWGGTPTPPLLFFIPSSSRNPRR